MNQMTRRADESARRPTNVSLSETLVLEARELGVNVSRACEIGLEQEVRQQRARQWHQENTEGFAAWNAYVETRGVPLSKYRKF